MHSFLCFLLTRSFLLDLQVGGNHAYVRRYVCRAEAGRVEAEAVAQELRKEAGQQLREVQMDHSQLLQALHETREGAMQQQARLQVWGGPLSFPPPSTNPASPAAVIID
jgi:hypothetical protein